MNDAAEEMVDKRVSRMSMLPDAIDEILKGEVMVRKKYVHILNRAIGTSSPFYSLYQSNH
eukprot:scaffold15465_cov200-Alexandrium_tamarense.AAC.8